MGFTSTFTTISSGIRWPDWFQEKYRDLIHFTPDTGIITAKVARVTWKTWREFPEDIQRAVDWSATDSLVLIYLHECGGVTRVQIERDRIVFTEPTGWEVVEGVMHDDWCAWACSDADGAEKPSGTSVETIIKEALSRGFSITVTKAT